MSDCATDDMHMWQFMFTLGNTKTLIEAVFGCHCGKAKKVDMRWEFEQFSKAHPSHPDHPNQRFAERQARAARQEEESGDEAG